jgi:hypothetical protein
LSAHRRELRDGDITALAAALGVLDVVEREGLRPPDADSQEAPPRIAPDRVRLVCFQVVHR